MSEVDPNEDPAAGENPEPVEVLALLKQESIVAGLSLLQRSADGRSYAYTDLKLTELEEKI